MRTATCWVRKLPWRRKWQPTPVFLPGIPHGQRSLAGYSPWGCKESDVTKVTEDTHTHKRIVLQPLSWGVHSSWILVGCSLTLVVTCPMHSCAAGLCVCVCVCMCWGWSVQRSRGGWACLTLTSQQPGTSPEGRGPTRTAVQCEPRPVGLTQWPPSEGRTGCRA